ncbi:DNA topoisomerase III [Candidatus Kinetoplastibacterium blastocrithidii (ex Strigomonas culicis)]|uniref:DNA topoisomerase III n=1 Tax=Candidatus Kinetoplastidibacterium blastocrithidiae TaxID=233181 RepID=UPI0002A676FD|nr:DNA topoisomerase III [Candidatus Kinetoplastibacterium blastocrithidii]AFZ83360.1 DNA topoisomerase III [Candidatus Kinetoplastibacterium blastocrithidii (ex Strigomonas culicis)]
MDKQLIIAEKPSVANDISKALGGFKKNNEFYENEDYVITSSIGHLLTLSASNEPSKGKWNLSSLPIIPNKFELIPIDKRASERLKLLNRSIKRKDIKSIINACDAGREGELIFRYIIEFSKTKKQVYRLWLQSMTKDAIQDAFKNLRTDEQLKSLEHAARSRAEADWLIGINGTRAMTAFNSKDGGFFKTTVGRVQTPTLTIVSKREKQIKNFISQDYWELVATFESKNGSYDAKWVNSSFKKNDNDPEKRESRIWSYEEASRIKRECENTTGFVYDKSKKSTQLSPSLYDLTSLQREANIRFGLSAKTTLNLAQSLYEKHKALTYPRTDSRHLPEDYITTVKDTIKLIYSTNTEIVDNIISNCAGQITQNQWVKLNQRVFNNKKISDHFAIVPTLQIPNKLSELEVKIYVMVLKRFLAVFFPAAEYLNTIRTTEVNEHKFKTEGKILTNPGWLSVYNKDNQNTDIDLVRIIDNEIVTNKSVIIKDLTTKPPARYNEASILSAMEGAGKLIEDEELREAISERGLGTPATRASIIEGLISEQYLRRFGKELIPTAKANQLMTLLSGLNIKELTSPELTGEWEQKLKKIEQNKLESSIFMNEIVDMTKNIVKKTKEYENNNVPGDYVTFENPCPKCGGKFAENYRRYCCLQCDFSISKHPGSRTFELQEVEYLLKNKKIGPLDNFVSKSFRSFSATLYINNDWKLEFDFGQNNDNDIANISEQETLGNCPKCSGSVFENNNSYICSNNINEQKKCDFRINKNILHQEISNDQIIKLLTIGSTSLLDGFISARTKRKFKAYLTLNHGKIEFKFEKNKKTKDN